MQLVSLQTGSPYGKPLVLLHGWGADTTFLMPIAKMFPDRNIIAIDLPGYGFNLDLFHKVHTFEETAKAILESIPHHSDMLAWSLGSLFAFRACSLDCMHKIDSLITLCGTPRFPQDPNWPGMKSNIVIKCKSLLTKTRCKRIIKYFTKLQSVEIDRVCPDSVLLEHLLKCMPEVSYEALQFGIDTMSFVDERDDFNFIKIPTFHLFGAKDRLVPSVTSEKLLLKKSAKCYIFENSAHVPHLTEPIIFERKLRNFFKIVE